MRNILLFGLLLVASHHAQAQTYSLVVQPILTPRQTTQAFTPLTNYLSEATGVNIRLVTALNFVTYWETMKKGDYDLVLDAAHFTDFRIKRLRYRVLVRIPDTVSLALVTAGDLLIFEPAELIGRRLGTLGSPSMPAVRANQLFPNPSRLPVFVDFANASDTVRALLDGEIAGAIIPSPLVQNYPELNTVLTTDPIPHIALSASPQVPVALANRIREALVNIDRTPAGRRTMEALRLAPFVPATSRSYDGYAQLLDGVWGY
ncbi:MAG: phosphate/phosphite/phosphonate ABC transporter substrate-binding protein [Gammaproteobacteria bacterium]|nr:phosphate/phosphite/phosphonate ABC transporter substrate-binding protein [Gammaproteobacteria bacterium]